MIRFILRLEKKTSTKLVLQVHYHDYLHVQSINRYKDAPTKLHFSNPLKTSA